MTTATTITGAATARAVAFVAARRDTAEQLGRSLAEHVNDPDAFTRALHAGLAELADPEYRAGQRLIAPGIAEVLGVRWPLLAAVSRGFRTATRRDPASPLLAIADRLFREKPLELRWFAFGLLERLVAADPERSWQLLRRGSRETGDWITVDTLAHPFGRGILLERYRWTELGQLVFSPSRWERRLVGSTIATIPFIDRREGRHPDIAARGLLLLGDLIGDADPDVQKALAWALRSLVLVDAAAVEAFCRREAAIAQSTSDGHRAWVIRDALPKLPPATAAPLRRLLAGVRRRSGAPATSRAAATAAQFSQMDLGAPLPEPPLA